MNADNDDGKYKGITLTLDIDTKLPHENSSKSKPEKWRFFSNKKNKINYQSLLKARGLKRPLSATILHKTTSFVASLNIILLVFIAVIISTVAAWSVSCNGVLISQSDCRERKFEKTIISTTPENTTKKQTEITKELDGGYLDGDVFRNFILMFAFVLAFIKWQIGNRQSAMSEIFERKRASNLHIINNKSAIQDLLSGALKIKNADNREKIIFKESEANEKIKDFFENNPHGMREITFDQKMFVYMELDNLEFALAKYAYGYLDSEQMYRACEIFESRCRDALFRHIAAKQGLTYYTEEFQNLVLACLIFGYAYSPENKKSDNKK